VLGHVRNHLHVGDHRVAVDEVLCDLAIRANVRKHLLNNTLPSHLSLPNPVWKVV
jgi:hypothetical protein